MIEITTHVRGAAAMRATAAYLQAMALIAEAEVAAARGQTMIGGAVSNNANGQQAEQARAISTVAKPAAIDPLDNPEAGAPLPPPVVLPPAAVAVTDLAAAVAAFTPQVPAAPASVPLPPPTVPVAPVAASATTPPPAPPVAASSPSGGVDLDKRGMPWSARIHSTPATKTAEGVWRKRRGVDDVTVAQVEAELRAALGAPAPAATQQAAPAPSVPVVPPTPTSTASQPVPVPPPAGPAASAVPQPPSVPAPSAASAPGEPVNLADLLALAGPLMTAQKITMATVIDACRGAGLDGLAGLQVRADLVPVVWQAVLAKVAA